MPIDVQTNGQAGHDVDDELGEVIADYLRRLSGPSPIFREELLEAHPDLADELEEFLANHHRMQDAVKPLREIRLAIKNAVGAMLPLRSFGDYELLDEIARGGMGVVFKARQLSLNRLVALKMILAGHWATEAEVSRFRAEAQAAANLHHPGVVAIHEVGVHEGQHFYSMEYVDGQSLGDLVRDTPLPADRAARYVRDVATIVQFAHEQGLLHRDLKPSNVLIDASDQVRITDFGLAKRLSGANDLTVTGQVIGTPSYMPPEQAAAQHALIGPTSDVYALGSILYTLIAGHPPFQSESVVETLRQVQQDEPARPRSLNPHLPKDLETICLKCIEKDPSRRYPTAQALADDLGRFLDGEPIRARAVGRVESAWRLFRRKPLVSGLTAAVCFLALVLGIGAPLAAVREARMRDAQAATLLNGLLVSKIEATPDLIEDMTPVAPLVLPRLIAVLDQSSDADQMLRAALAIVGLRPSMPEFQRAQEHLMHHLKIAEPGEVPVICQAIICQASKEERASKLKTLWEDAKQAGPGERQSILPVAPALMRMQGDEVAGWKAVEGRFAQELSMLPSFIAMDWLRALPAQKEPPWDSLLEVLGNPASSTAQRNNLREVILSRGEDDPRILARATYLADHESLTVFCDALAKVEPPERAIRELEKLWADYTAGSKNKAADDAAQVDGKANLAAALARLGHPEVAWTIFEGDDSMPLPHVLVHRLALAGCDSKLVLDRLRIALDEKDVHSLPLLCQALGEFPVEEWSRAVRDADLLRRLDTAFRGHPDGGVHSSLEWLLRRWKGDQFIERLRKSLAVPDDSLRHRSVRWYVNNHEHTMIVLEAGNFWMGAEDGEGDRNADEKKREVTINRRFAISSHEVTQAQYLQFFENHVKQLPESLRIEVIDTCPEDHCPIGALHWYQAAAYCNALSEAEGISEDQWCYEPVDIGSPTAGMRMKPDYLFKIGYRLPTEAEWEFSCRAGSSGTRFFGAGPELLSEYAWNKGNARQGNGQSRMWPVGRLKPNPFGLFDMLGNAWEWTQYRTLPTNAGKIFDRDVDELTPQVSETDCPPTNIRKGGCYDTELVELRASKRSQKGELNSINGFRIARTMPK